MDGSECVGDENRTMLSRIGCPYIPHLRNVSLNLSESSGVKLQFSTSSGSNGTRTQEGRNKEGSRKEKEVSCRLGRCLALHLQYILFKKIDLDCADAVLCFGGAVGAGCDKGNKS